MGIGERKQIQLVQIQQQQGADGIWGAPTDGVKFGVWAEVSNPSGFRGYDNGQTQMGNTRRFLVRFRFDKYPGADWIVRYQSKDWTIQQIQQIDEKRFYWSIVAETKQPRNVVT